MSVPKRKMTTSHRLIAAFSMVLSIAGCCPNGCFVLIGDAYRALVHPPIRKRWERANIVDAQRQTDWQDVADPKAAIFHQNQAWSMG